VNPVRDGLLIETGVRGLYGRSAEFEDTIERVDRLVSAAGAADGAKTVRFPPILNRTHFERSGFLASFPHLAGTVHAFDGNRHTDHTHRQMLRAVEEGSDWSGSLSPTEVVLTPAACYPVYPTLAGTLPATGRLIDVMSYCFRHEPSDDPARMQMFRMHEHVRAADPPTIAAWLEVWQARATRLTQELGLDARCAVASDPFFGRSGKLLASAQFDRRLKLELVTTIASDDCPTAIISLNSHHDHFGGAFGINTADGAVAHTACVGFGLERIALALYRQHRVDRALWPPTVRTALGF
jgi:seryl-tRNA synthetase